MTNVDKPGRIALISATAAAIGPATDALNRELPEAEIWNLLDDTLLSDALSEGGVTPNLRLRMKRLISHAREGGAAGILLTCSMYGAIAQETNFNIPVLAADQAAFDELIDGHYAAILIVGSLQSAVSDSMTRLSAAFDAAHASAVLIGTVVEGASVAASHGGIGGLTDLIAKTCSGVVEPYDAILLAQYSLAPATQQLSAKLRLPVVSGPLSAAALMKTRMT